MHTTQISFYQDYGCNVLEFKRLYCFFKEVLYVPDELTLPSFAIYPFFQLRKGIPLLFKCLLITKIVDIWQGKHSAKCKCGKVFI